MSSFRKRTIQKPIAGTRTSPQTGQLITSSGNPSLDVILGGGLPIGSICLIEEDKYVTYSKVLTKYFVAEGIVSQQSIFLGSLDDDPSQILRRLPKPLNEDEVEQDRVEDVENGEVPKNGLRIAWRYNDLPIVNSELPTIKIGHHFNLMEPMDTRFLDYAEATVWNDKPHCLVQERVHEDDEIDHFNMDADSSGGTVDSVTNVVLGGGSDGDGEAEGNKDVEMENAKNAAATVGMTVASVGDERVGDNHSTTTAMDLDVHRSDDDSTTLSTPPSVNQNPKIFANQKYTRIMKEIHPLLREDKYNTGIMGLSEKCLMRVCITSLGSPLWYDEHFGTDILKFLTVLRAIVRGSVAVCIITMPMHLVAKSDESLVAKIRNLVDYAIELESFAGSERETNPAFKDYNGLLHLHKITAINTLSAYVPETTDLAFKLRRKKFIIEKLHLPPELQDSSEGAPNAEAAVPTLSCGSNNSPHAKKASLDF